jgi:hypothetical protein
MGKFDPFSQKVRGMDLWVKVIEFLERENPTLAEVRGLLLA